MACYAIIHNWYTGLPLSSLINFQLFFHIAGRVIPLKHTSDNVTTLSKLYKDSHLPQSKGHSCYKALRNVALTTTPLPFSYLLFANFALSSFLFWNRLGMVLPQGLCTIYSVCVDCSSHRFLAPFFLMKKCHEMSFLHEISPSHWGLL